MIAACLKLLSIIVLITIATASFITDRDKGDCASASPTDRLTTNETEPRAYQIRLVLRPNFNQFSGTCNITLRIHHPTRTIRIHAYKIKLSLCDIKLSRANSMEPPIEPLNYRYCTASQILELQFEEDIPSGTRSLKFSFSARNDDEQYKGVIQFRYQTSNQAQRLLLTNLLEPIEARRMFPCWDEPSIKAMFNITITHPKEYTVLSNMKITKCEFRPNNVYRTRFAATPLIAPSEVAFVMFDSRISEAKAKESSFTNNERNIFHRPLTAIPLEFARTMIYEVKEYMSTYISGLNKAPKTDIVVIPRIPVKAAGSLGLVIYRETYISYYENQFVGHKLSILKLLVHEEARQWFSGPLTASGWSDMWLRESLAMFFSQSFTMESHYVSGLLEKLFVVQVLQPTLRDDLVLRMKSVVHEAGVIDEIDAFLYSRLYPYKGSVLLRMLQHVLTPKKFNEHVDVYVQQSILHPDKCANFWETLTVDDNAENKQMKNMSDIMDSWLRQRHYPVLNVSCDYNTTRIETYCENGTTWHIPVNIFAVSNIDDYNHTSEITWLQCPESYEIPVISDIAFVVLNLRQVGYYRVNYESKNWMKIALFLQYFNHTAIPVENRAQLIDDAYYFMMKGEVDFVAVCGFIEYLKRETHFVPWYPMFNILSDLYPYMKIRKGEFLKPVMMDSLDSLLINIGYEERSTDDEMTKSLRLLAAQWACKLGLQKCLEAATAQLQASVENLTQISPWWKDWVYCMGMKKLDINTWHALLANVTKNNDTNIFKYLACTDNTIFLNYYLNVLIKDDNMSNFMKSETLIKHFCSILKSHVRKDDVLKHVLQNIEIIVDRIFETKNVAELWGNIIFNVYPEQLNMVEKSLKEVPARVSLQSNESEKLLNAQLREENAIIRKFIYI